MFLRGLATLKLRPTFRFCPCLQQTPKLVVKHCAAQSALRMDRESDRQAAASKQLSSSSGCCCYCCCCAAVVWWVRNMSGGNTHGLCCCCCPDGASLPVHDAMPVHVGCTGVAVLCVLLLGFLCCCFPVYQQDSLLLLLLPLFPHSSGWEQPGRAEGHSVCRHAVETECVSLLLCALFACVSYCSAEGCTSTFCQEIEETED